MTPPVDLVHQREMKVVAGVESRAVVRHVLNRLLDGVASEASVERFSDLVDVHAFFSVRTRSQHADDGGRDVRRGLITGHRGVLRRRDGCLLYTSPSPRD